MALLFRTAGAWGAGLGRDLEPEEVDGNFWDLQQQITNLVDNPVQPAQIASFEVEGTTFKVIMSNGAEFGPYPLPVLTFTWLEDGWQNDVDLHTLDTFTVPGQGLFMVLQDHHTPDAPAEFDPDAVGEDLNPLYQLMIGAIDETQYDIAFNYPEAIPGGFTLLGQFVANRILNLAEDLPNLQAFILDATTDGPMELTVSVNGTGIGTITFTPGENIAANGSSQYGVADTSAVTMNPGDYLHLYGPTTADSTAGKLAVTIPATRG